MLRRPSDVAPGMPLAYRPFLNPCPPHRSTSMTCPYLPTVLTQLRGSLAFPEHSRLVFFRVRLVAVRRFREDCRPPFTHRSVATERRLPFFFRIPSCVLSLPPARIFALRSEPLSVFHRTSSPSLLLGLQLRSPYWSDDLLPLLRPGHDRPLAGCLVLTSYDVPTSFPRVGPRVSPRESARLTSFPVRFLMPSFHLNRDLGPLSTFFSFVRHRVVSSSSECLVKGTVLFDAAFS